MKELKVTKTVYIANDGTEFNSQKNCEDYEKQSIKL